MAKRFCVQPTPGQAMREPYLTARIFLTVPTAEAGLLRVEAEADTPRPQRQPCWQWCWAWAGRKGALLGGTSEDGTQGGSCSASKHRAVLRAGAHGRQEVLWGGAAPESSCPSSPRARRCCPTPPPPTKSGWGLCSPTSGSALAAWGPASGTALGLWVAAAKPEAVARPQGTTPGLAAKTGRMLARVPKGRAVDSEAARVAWVPPPQASWPGPEAGAWAGAGAPRFPVWTELSKALALSRRPSSGAPTRSVGWLQGSRAVSERRWGCRNSAGRLEAPWPARWTVTGSPFRREETRGWGGAPGRRAWAGGWCPWWRTQRRRSQACGCAG